MEYRMKGRKKEEEIGTKEEEDELQKMWRNKSKGGQIKRKDQKLITINSRRTGWIKEDER